MIISSQEYLNEEIVAEKIAACDFEVQVSPAFVIDGEIYQVILDGHHSFAAAIKAGVAPVLVERTATDDDRIGLLTAGNIDDFMATCWMDSDWRDAVTGRHVW
ncbi:hypothetical protein P7L78_21880 [Tistrella bauzanensis]|uniref:hypothetical protein n=1 Tax=Tistrella TaxID=171436 RepID=UPI0031F651E2